MNMGEIDWPVWIGVVAEDLDAQRRFYRDVLGFHEAESSDDWIEFDLGPGRKFELLRRTEDPQYDRPRYQVGFSVPDIQAAVRELEARGAERISGIQGDPEANNRWCYFRDPEGNVFEVTQRG